MAVAIKQPAGADAAVEKPAVAESITLLTTCPLPSRGYFVDTLSVLVEEVDAAAANAHPCRQALALLGFSGMEDTSDEGLVCLLRSVFDRMAGALPRGFCSNWGVVL